MRKYFKFFISLILIPLTRFYLRKKRKYTYKDTTVTVLPGVFHPGLFSSTSFLLDFLSLQNLENKIFLELGCGSGLISVIAAKAHARVTAIDVSLKAIENTKLNAQENNVPVKIVRSDLFSELSPMVFDWIAINPPYYGKVPKTEEELAWNCGEDFEYFQRLFAQLPCYINAHTVTVMVLTKGCDLERIFEIAGSQGFHLEQIAEKKVIFDEKDFLFQVKS